MGRSRGYELCAFAEALETRGILREAVRSGAVKYRAAQEVLPVAVGAAEEYWTRRAATTTVRVLAKEVARLIDRHAEEPWFRMVASVEPEHRLVLDEALRVTGRLEPHASVCGRLEAKRLTVIALRRLLDRVEDARMRGQGKVKAFLPRSVAYLLAAAMETARRRVDVPLSDGECLAIIAAHFLRTYAEVAKRRVILSQRVRERDGGFCTVPGCSARADDAHHIEFLSRGGHRTALWNQTSGCKCHHVCVHELGLRVSGEAPDALVWTLHGEPFTGR